MSWYHDDHCINVLWCRSFYDDSFDNVFIQLPGVILPRIYIEELGFENPMFLKIMRIGTLINISTLTLGESKS